MAIIKRVTTAKNKITAKSSSNKTHNKHIIDGVQYKSNTLVQYHKEMKEAIVNKWIKTFTLPHIGDGQEQSKFGAYKAEIDNQIFDSVMEARYYVYLCGLKKNKKIKSFKCQFKFELQPKFKNKFTNKTVLPINYISDFVVVNNDNSKTVIDIKGLETADFKIKKKLMQYKYPNLNFKCIQWVAKTKSWEDLDDIKKRRREAKKLK